MQSFTQFIERMRVALTNDHDRDRFTHLIAQCEGDLCPRGMLENVFASMVLSGLWRLEQNPALTEADRARIENSLRRNTAELRRLQTDRHLKAEFNLDLPGLISAKEVLKLRKQKKSSNLQSEPNSELAKAVELDILAELEEEEAKKRANLKIRTHLACGSPSSSQQTARAGKNIGQRTHLATRPAPAVGRNGPCPCRSGQKYKRCCGSGAPPIYQNAA